MLFDCRHALRSAAHSRSKKFTHLVLLAILSMSLLPMGTGQVLAHSNAEESGPQRQVVEMGYGVTHHWLLKAWANQSVVCGIDLTGDGRPGEEDVRLACGNLVAKDWAATPACDAASEGLSTEACKGYYLVDLGSSNQSYKIIKELPAIQITYKLENCTSGVWCDERPVFHFYAKEPLESEKIKTVYIRTGTRLEFCETEGECLLNVPVTTRHGAWLEYWADSTYGDESEHHFLLMRNIYQADTASRYYVEALEPEYIEDTAELQWKAFPALDHPEAAFYSTHFTDNMLDTHNHLFYLSGRLINIGWVDTNQCSAAVLLANGNADTCGEAAAYSTVVQWQNRYDPQILAASRTYGLPARILKGILAQESQFWPDPQIRDEYGLGSLTENGVDALLVTDLSNFLRVCLSAMDAKDCAAGYAALSPGEKGSLRGLMLQSVGTQDEIDLIARVVLAQVVQVGQVMQDVTGEVPGQYASYEDLWDLTIASYHAGVGCISEGLQELKDTAQPITFDRYCKVATSGCQSACTFTTKVKNYMAESVDISEINLINRAKLRPGAAAKPR